jgi:hypothetical protein
MRLVTQVHDDGEDESNTRKSGCNEVDNKGYCHLPGKG